MRELTTAMKCPLLSVVLGWTQEDRPPLPTHSGAISGALFAGSTCLQSTEGQGQAMGGSIVPQQLNCCPALDNLHVGFVLSVLWLTQGPTRRLKVPSGVPGTLLVTRGQHAFQHCQHCCLASLPSRALHTPACPPSLTLDTLESLSHLSPNVTSVAFANFSSCSYRSNGLLCVRAS